MSCSHAMFEPLAKWIEKVAEKCKPERIHICSGSDVEYEMLTSQMVEEGSFIRLSRPNSFLCRSDPNDVARIEEVTFICSALEEDAGPTNHWKSPEEMEKILDPLFEGCMKGRVMYVIGFCMGPLESIHSRLGVQITDSPYVVCSMNIMTHMGEEVFKKIEETKQFIPCLHSVGKPLEPGEKDQSWPCNSTKYITHFPEEKKIISYGSGYGGNALLGKKSLALRIASKMAKEEGWLAEHMLIIGVTSPEGEKKYIAAAFPSQCGKTNLAMLKSPLPGWKIECVGDDIAWMWIDEQGQLRAINPEAGFFGVAPGTSEASNPYAMKTIEKNTIFTNVALTPDCDVWWESMTSKPPEGLVDWRGNLWKKESSAAHPNSRFTVKANQCPIFDPHALDVEGVPISAILFGGRRSSVVPLVAEAFSWNHGVFLGASISSETTAAAAGDVGKLRHDPFAMLPFCGYHMGDYFSHWIQMGTRLQKPVKLFYVNWFRKDQEGKFLWPGFGQNMKVLEWIFRRCEKTAPGKTSAIGILPEDFDADPNLFNIDHSSWLREVDEIEAYFKLFSPKMPKEVLDELLKLKERLSE